MLEEVLKTRALFSFIGAKSKVANRLINPEFRWPVNGRARPRIQVFDA